MRLLKSGVDLLYEAREIGDEFSFCIVPSALGPDMARLSQAKVVDFAAGSGGSMGKRLTARY